MAREYEETQWTPMHTSIKAETLRELQEFEDKHPDVSKDTFDEKLIREDLQFRVEFLKEMDTKFTDLGPTYDCGV